MSDLPSAGFSQIKGTLRDRRADVDPRFLAMIRKAASLPDGAVHLKSPDGVETTFTAEAMRQWIDGEDTAPAWAFQEFLESLFK